MFIIFWDIRSCIPNLLCYIKTNEQRLKFLIWKSFVSFKRLIHLLDNSTLYNLLSYKTEQANKLTISKLELVPIYKSHALERTGTRVPWRMQPGWFRAAIRGVSRFRSRVHKRIHAKARSSRPRITYA